MPIHNKYIVWPDSSEKISPGTKKVILHPEKSFEKLGQRHKKFYPTKKNVARPVKIFPKLIGR